MVFLIEMMSYSDTNSLEDAIFVSLYSTDVVFGGSASFPLRCAVQAGALSPHKPRPTCRSARGLLGDWFMSLWGGYRQGRREEGTFTSRLACFF